MRRVLFVAAVLAGCAIIVLGAAKGLGYEPQNPADAPPPRVESESEMLEAATRGCVAGGGTAWMGREGNVYVFKCRPWLALPVTK